MELNVPFPNATIAPPNHRHPNVTEATVEHIFAFVDEKKRNNSPAALQAVDVKIGLWESFHDNFTYGGRHRYIHACRQAAGSPRGLLTTFVPKMKPLMLDEDDRYERCLARAGLVDQMAVL